MAVSAPHTAEEGQELIAKAVAETTGQKKWDEDSVLGFLLGLDGSDYQDVWHLDRVDAVLQSHRLPCWILTSIAEPGGPRGVLWSNAAARKQLGAPRTFEQIQAYWSAMPVKFLAAAKEILMTLYHLLQVKKQQLRMNMHLSLTLRQNWTSIPEGYYGRMREEAIQVMIDGEATGCYLCCIEKELSAEQLRGAALTTCTPIHSHMFSNTGQQLYASANATVKQQNSGVAKVADFTLAQLLVLNGRSQPDLAQDALRRICQEKAQHHCVTLSTTQSNGEMRHTLYEMWPAQDPVDVMQPVMIVSCIDVTHQKRTELELQALKQALQRHNTDLQQKVEESHIKQAAMEAERIELQGRLKDALELHLTPRTQIDTTSPIDRTVALLDGLLAGKVPGMRDVLLVKNTLMQTPELRHMADLEKQLKQQAVSADVSDSLVSLLQGSKSATKKLSAQLSSLYLSTSPRADKLDKSDSRSFKSKLSKSACALSYNAGSDDALQAQRHRLQRMSASLRTRITPEIDRLLQESMLNWSFDMRRLDAATEGHSLSCFGFWLLQHTGLMSRWKLPEEQMALCLKAIERGYCQDNPYHNRVHAASVLHMCSNLVRSEDGLIEADIVEDTLELSMYLAAICHDYEHPGLTNDYLISSRHEYAMVYNDRSPLEQHHASAAYHVLYRYLNSGNHKLDTELDHVMRTTIIELILATDMKQHFALVSRLQGAYQVGSFTDNPQPRLSDESMRDLDTPASKDRFIPAEHRLLAAQAALKCADVGHLTLPDKLHKAWVDNLQQEFFRQGDKEREAGLPISALMDRHKSAQLSNSQVGFFEVVALPLFRSMAAVVPATQPMLNNAMANYRMWRNVSEDQG